MSDKGHPVGAFMTLGRVQSVHSRKAYGDELKILWDLNFDARSIGIAHRVQSGEPCIVVSEVAYAGNGKAPYQCVLTSVGLWWADPADLVAVR
jgi:hypothetical protein